MSQTNSALYTKMYQEMSRKLPEIVTSSNARQSIPERERDQCSRLVSEIITKEFRERNILIKDAMETNVKAANEIVKVGIDKIVEEAKSIVKVKTESLVHDGLSKLKDDLNKNLTKSSRERRRL